MKNIMTKPILNATEYDFLGRLLQWAMTSVYQEPELCLKEINYSSASRIVSRTETKGDPDKGLGAGLHTEYEPTGIDPIKTGECGLGLADDMEYVLDEPNADNIYTMIENIMYKLNLDGQGNSWETLAPLVDYEKYSSIDEDSATMQSYEGYVVENIQQKNRSARLKEHYDNVSEDGMIDLGNGTFLDGSNSDIL
tara:strand:- start:137 stop:721 length:585 start_codon:yes stop_codon:yes gene_type:complete